MNPSNKERKQGYERKAAPAMENREHKNNRRQSVAQGSKKRGRASQPNANPGLLHRHDSGRVRRGRAR